MEKIKIKNKKIKEGHDVNCWFRKFRKKYLDEGNLPLQESTQ